MRTLTLLSTLLAVACAPEPSDTTTKDPDDEATPLPFGPDNDWPHATTDEVPEGLAGTGTGVGDIVGDFTLVDQNGDEVQLYQFYGNVVQLVLFAEWCGPCQEEAPDVQAASVDLADDGVVVVSVMMDRLEGGAADATSLARWAAEYGVTHPLLAGPGDLEGLIQGGYPTLPVIGRDMRIVKADNYPFDPGYLAELAAR
jgi:thiol-disulfide isomerase/thioredoxin